MPSATRPFTIVDFNNFWSPSGGGVRRYHLQKMAFYEKRALESQDVLSVFVMPDNSTYTEKRSDTLIIEHVEAFRFPGNWEYRFIWKASQVIPVLEKYRPDIIEVGSPYILPTVVRRAAKKVSPESVLVGFWHADFPVTYVGRPVAKKLGAKIGTFSRNRAFWYARKEYKNFDCIQASSKEAMARLKKNGLPDPRWIPLGCDIQTFSPNKRDEALVSQLKDGVPERLTIFFPHRHCNEKGIDLILGAYDILANKLGHEPAIVFGSRPRPKSTSTYSTWGSSIPSTRWRVTTPAPISGSPFPAGRRSGFPFSKAWPAGTRLSVPRPAPLSSTSPSPAPGRFSRNAPRRLWPMPSSSFTVRTCRP